MSPGIDAVEAALVQAVVGEVLEKERHRDEYTTGAVNGAHAVLRAFLVTTRGVSEDAAVDMGRALVHAALVERGEQIRGEA